ncbi:putative fibronectin type III domain-containing protein [Escherichia coli P0302293.10]|uniref:hypothetical protein n=1 Tax=Escherichia coli TaxID=562 RepID=UPI0002C9E495|nr:putative fibronectin type III domain-containing protein [Escherichia coli P0302293.10]
MLWLYQPGAGHRAGLWLIKTNCWNADRGLQRGCEGLRHVPGMSLKSAMMTMPVSAPGRVLAVNSQTRTLTLDREITLPSPDHADKPG